MMLLILLFSAIAVVASSDLLATNTETSINLPSVSLFKQSGVNIANIIPLAVRQDEMEVGSPCHGLEGEWNCMTTTFQRCASGQWSMVLDTAYGTVCEPAGFTYDFQPAFASWFPPKATDKTQTIVCTATATATSDPTDATNTGSSGAPVAGEATSRSAVWATLLGLTSTALLFLSL